MTQTPDRTESVFAAAVVLETLEERAAYLDQACAGDPSLRERVDALLRAHDGVVDLLDRLVPAGLEQTAAYLPSEQPGTVVAGRYKLLESIGEGGMGTVWVAEQTQPVRRKVALKLIKPGMDSKSVLARFEAERQALAVMDHPNIAKVLDGGLTETGRPFFVMEYVKGVPITEYCEAARLSISERLQLFVQVCQAVQHAHQKGIIHRDLKPSNILVAPYDDRAVPKVIDFGLAKAIHQPLTERTLHTDHAAVLGTPLYMSPEQAQLNNLDVDTRSDLYSLGVLLYELLTGTTPLEKQRFKEAAWDEVRRIIREEEPPRPSMRLSSSQTLPALAAARQTEPAQLTKLVRGELDWIVMKALEKDRTRRYDTANGFASDVQRYLDDEPVLACPPSTGYYLRKLLRKHRAAIAIAATFAVVLLVAAAVSTWQWREAEAARSVAVSKADAEVQARKNAELSKQAEADAKGKAEAESAAKGKALRQAEALRLTAQSSAVLPANPGLALLLAIEGAERAAPRQAEQNDALLAALNQCRELHTIVAPAVAPNPNLERHVACTAVCVSHDGRRIAAASVRMAKGFYQSLTWDDKLVQVWDAKTGARLAEFMVPGLTPATIEFSPDDRLVLTTYQGTALVRYADGGQIIYSDHAARVWDAASGREVAVLKGHTDRVVTAHFSPDGKRIVTASWDKTVRVWDAGTGAVLAVLQGDRFSLASAMFSADGSRVLTVSSGGFSNSKAERPSGQEGKLEFDFNLRAGQAVAEVTSLFSQRPGGRISAGREVSAARIWDAASGTALHVLGKPDPAGLDGGSGPGAMRVQSSSTGPTDTNEEALSAAFSPDGSCVATGSWLGTVKIWSAETGKPLRSWKGIAKKIQSLDFSPDGRRLLLVYSDEFIKDEVATSPTGFTHATSAAIRGGDNKDEVAVWSTSDGKEIVRWRRFSSGVRAAHFSPNGRHVLIVPGNEMRQRQAKSLPGASGELVLAGPEDRTVYLRDAESGEDVALLKGHEGNVMSAQFNADGSRIVTAGGDGTVRVWNSGDRWQYPTVLPGHASAVAEAAFSLDGRCAMTTFGLRLESPGATGGERSVRVWNTDTGILLRALKEGLGPMRELLHLKTAVGTTVNPVAEDQISGAVRHAEFSPDGSRLLTVSDDSFVRLYDDASPDGGMYNNPPGSPLKLSTGASVLFAPVRVWDVASGKKLASLTGFKAGVRWAAFSPDGRRIVTVTDNIYKHVLLDAKNQYRGAGYRGLMINESDAGVRVWDAESGRQIAALLGPGPDIFFGCGAAWSPDGKFLFTAEILAQNRSRLQIWNSTTLQPVQELQAGEKTLAWTARQRPPVFSPDSRRVLLLQTDQDQKLVTVWEVDGGEKRVELRGHQGPVNEAAFSPDGKWVVTASNDGTARVWNAATGEQVFKVGDERNAMHTASFSPDGRWIVTASDDSTARLWYADTGREYFKLSGHRGPVFCAAFSPDSHYVLTGSGDGTARIWPIDPLPAAISRKPRDLTDRERETFLNQQPPSR